jgi:hypothetical protein
MMKTYHVIEYAPEMFLVRKHLNICGVISQHWEMEGKRVRVRLLDVVERHLQTRLYGKQLRGEHGS